MNSTQWTIFSSFDQSKKMCNISRNIKNKNRLESRSKKAKKIKGYPPPKKSLYFYTANRAAAKLG